MSCSCRVHVSVDDVLEDLRAGLPVRNLQLMNCNVGAADLARLWEGLGPAAWANVQGIYLASNPLGNEGVCGVVAAVLAARGVAPQLAAVNLNATGMDGACVGEICRWLESDSRGMQVYLLSNDIPAAGRDMLAQVCEAHPRHRVHTGAVQVGGGASAAAQIRPVDRSLLDF